MQNKITTDIPKIKFQEDFMKKSIARAGLGAIAAGLLFTGGFTVFASELPNEAAVAAHPSYGTAWRKKDKENEPKETPQASPTPGVQNEAPKQNQRETPNENPKETPKENPKQTPTNEPNEKSSISFDDENSFVRYYRGNTNNMGADGTYRNNSGSQTHPGTDYLPGITGEISKILANQPAIKLDPNSYIVQHEDGLWLVMGNIRARLDILIYVDQKHMEKETSHLERGNAIPLYK